MAASAEVEVEAVVCQVGALLQRGVGEGGEGGEWWRGAASQSLCAAAQIYSAVHYCMGEENWTMDFRSEN